MAEVSCSFRDQIYDVLPSLHPRNWTRQNVIKHQGRHGELRDRSTHRFLHHAIYTAAREHGARLDINSAHGVGEKHYAKNEPWCRMPDRLFSDAADVVSR